MATDKIRTKAIAFGVFNSPHGGNIIYVDPSREEEDIHSPLLTHAEAALAFQKGLIEDPGAAKVVDRTAFALSNEVDPSTLGPVGAERTAAAMADVGDDAGPAPIESRQSTAFPDRDRIEGGVQGYTDGVTPANARGVDDAMQHGADQGAITGDLAALNRPAGDASTNGGDQQNNDRQPEGAADGNSDDIDLESGDDDAPPVAGAPAAAPADTTAPATDAPTAAAAPKAATAPKTAAKATAKAAAKTKAPAAN